MEADGLLAVYRDEVGKLHIYLVPELKSVIPDSSSSFPTAWLLGRDIVDGDLGMSCRWSWIWELAHVGVASLSHGGWY